MRTAKGEPHWYRRAPDTYAWTQQHRGSPNSWPSFSRPPRESRHHIIRQNALNGQRLELPAADPALLRQYMKAQGYPYHRGPDRTGWFSPAGGPQQLQNVAEVLALEAPDNRSRAVAA